MKLNIVLSRVHTVQLLQTSSDISLHTFGFSHAFWFGFSGDVIQRNKIHDIHFRRHGLAYGPVHLAHVGGQSYVENLDHQLPTLLGMTGPAM